jgi:predicted nucleotidyltransferase
MVSYSDRPDERERDLEDIAHLFDAYVDDIDPRRWDDAPTQEHELASAYLLGLDTGRIAALEAHRDIVDRFLSYVLDPDSVRHAVMRRRGPRHWRSDDALARRLGAFQSGLRRGAKPPVPDEHRDSRRNRQSFSRRLLAARGRRK